MSKFIKAACTLSALITLALAGVIGLMRLQPQVLLSDETVAAHGSDNVLSIGNYILKYGTPTHEDYSCYPSWPSITPDCTYDVWWGSTEIDVETMDFTPYSTVQYTNEDDALPTGTIWRGFYRAK